MVGGWVGGLLFYLSFARLIGISLLSDSRSPIELMLGMTSVSFEQHAMRAIFPMQFAIYVIFSFFGCLDANELLLTLRVEQHIFLANGRSFHKF